MRAEQEYFRQKLRRHNRMLHGTGVVCGLEVADASTGDHPMRVSVSAGYAISPQGDEICLPKVDYLDLADCGKDSGDPCLPAVRSSIAVREASRAKGDFLIGIRYDECPSRPVRVMPAGCGWGDSSCDYSRTRDGWALGCWATPTGWKPDAGLGTDCAAIMKKLVSCPSESADVWVVLARVRFAANSTKIGDLANDVRHWVFSSTAIQGVCCRG
jgi:hypothetical protein